MTYAKLPERLDKSWTVSKHGVTVTVYPVQLKGKTRFQVVWYQLGERQKQTFLDPAAAHEAANEKVRLLIGQKTSVLSLSNTDAEIYKTIKSLADKTPYSLVDIVQAGIAKLKGQDDIKPILLSDAVTEFIKAKTADRRSPLYIRDLRKHLGWFQKKFDGYLHMIPPSSIEAWLYDQKVGPVFRNHLRNSTTTFFRWAARRGYVSKSFLEMSLPKATTQSEIAIYTVDELKTLMAITPHCLIPYISIGAFAGLRPYEIMRLQWSDFRWSSRLIEVRGKISKTRQRRLVPIHDNLWKILHKWFDRSCPLTGHVVQQKRPDSRMWAICKRNKFKLKYDGLRHSYCSYRYALTQDAARVCAETGHDQTTFFRDYRELVMPAEAKRYFELLN